MRKTYPILLLFCAVLLLTACLKRTSNRFECNINKQATLEVSVGNETYKPDDFISGAIFCTDEDYIKKTIVDLGMLSNGKPVSVLVKLDSFITRDSIYSNVTIKEASLGIGQDKFDLYIDTIRFNNFEDLNLNQFSVFEIIDFASGTITGKYVNPSNKDSIAVDVSFCFDESPIKTK